MFTTCLALRRVAILALVGAAMGACDQKPAAESATPKPPTASETTPPTATPIPASDAQFIPEATTPEGAAENTYTVRGVVVALPGPNRAKQFFQVHHEEIPEFVGRSGKVVGMKEMIMDFPDFASGEVVRGIAVGDAIRFTFEVRWKGKPRTLVTKIEKLPAEEKPVLQPIVESN